MADQVEQNLHTATTKSEQIAQSVLAKAFAEELVETEAELARRKGRDYEPDSVLLERIAAERTPSGTKSKPTRRKKMANKNGRPNESRLQQHAGQTHDNT